MKIVICDDNRLELEWLENLLRTHLNTRPDFPYQLTAFSSSKELLFELEDRGRADVYMLDIDMPGVNGLTIARKLRNLYPNMILFFYTSHAEYAMEGYQVEARRYILKGSDPSVIREAMDYACEKWQRLQRDTVSIFIYRDTVNVPIREILYARKDGRSCRIQTQNQGELKENGSLRELRDRMNKPWFLMIDKGVLINVNYVRRTYENMVEMLDGTTFPISRRKVAEVKEAIMRYWKRV